MMYFNITAICINTYAKEKGLDWRRKQPNVNSVYLWLVELWVIFSFLYFLCSLKFSIPIIITFKKYMYPSLLPTPTP